ncbi:unnamed protein product [Oikopleura dioica]|uniref:Ion transport domain-containing protein n=1 Tax=Oikopleura dioica TaxID=34765 RepID=E4YS05_OIKDI|nr:unnamed protein product [Oikopleura dioica]
MVSSLYKTPLGDSNYDEKCKTDIKSILSNSTDIDESRYKDYMFQECCDERLKRDLPAGTNIKDQGTNDVIKLLKSSPNASVPICYFSRVKTISYFSFVCINIMIFFSIFNLLRFARLSVFIGPLIYALYRTLFDVLKFVPIFLLLFLAYGVIQNNLLFPNQQAERDDVASWVFTEFTNIFNRPFFHVFGEIFIAETTTHRYYHTEAPCTHAFGDINLEDKVRCPERNEISSFIMSAYMLATNIVMVNMLIAMFNETYTKMKKNSKLIWATDRYKFILEEYHYFPNIFVGGLLQFLLCIWFVICLFIRFPVWIFVKIKRHNNNENKPTVLFDQKLLGRILPRRPVHSDPFDFRRRTKEFVIDENEEFDENPAFVHVD